MTQEHVDAEMATDIAMETESVRTAEKYTSITKDTGTVWLHHEKTCFRSFQPDQTQTELYSHRRWLKA